MLLDNPTNVSYTSIIIYDLPLLLLSQCSSVYSIVIHLAFKLFLLLGLTKGYQFYIIIFEKYITREVSMLANRVFFQCTHITTDYHQQLRKLIYDKTEQENNFLGLECDHIFCKIRGSSSELDYSSLERRQN